LIKILPENQRIAIRFNLTYGAKFKRWHDIECSYESPINYDFLFRHERIINS